MKTTSVNVNGILPISNKPVKSFFGIDSPKSSPNGQASKDSKPKKLLSADDLPAFKQAIVGSDLSKVGLIEVLKKQFPGRPAAAIKSTLEQVARRGRPGEKEKDKRWLLVDA
jgi:chromatin assembly factor 1 subunit A